VRHRRAVEDQEEEKEIQKEEWSPASLLTWHHGNSYVLGCGWGGNCVEPQATHWSLLHRKCVAVSHAVAAVVSDATGAAVE
jgi:hypothetical protein